MPPDAQPSPVEVRREALVLPTYAPRPADLHPQFIENRVYQGSSGKVRMRAAAGVWRAPHSAAAAGCCCRCRPMRGCPLPHRPSRPQVYPLPFIDSISETAEDQEWDAVWLDNGLVRLLLLPQLGGRIHAAEVRV